MTRPWPSSSSTTTFTMASSPDTNDWLICTACGTQFPTPDRQKQTTCFICDDPRQFTPPTGQSFTTLGQLRAAGHKNVFQPYEHNNRITFLHTVPKVGIGQRCALIRIRTARGARNVLWDCVTLLDDATVAHIQALGGLAAIVISHPHYYSTHLLWARTFGCKVYLAAEDRGWLSQTDPARQVFIETGETEVDLLGQGQGDGGGGGGGGGGGDDSDGCCKALKLGGHFPGSLVLLLDGHLLVADTLVTTPAGLGSWETDAVGTRREPAGGLDQRHLGRPEGMNTFAFMWSIPNMIPLSPEDISQMWAVLSKHEFTSTHGAFMGQDIEDGRIKEKVLESMQIQIRNMGWKEHAFLKMTV